MTNKEAAEIMKAIIFILKGDDYSDEVEEAIHMAIKALEALDAAGDTISRRAALDALRTCYDTETVTMSDGDEYINYEDAVGEIEQLPSAQPDYQEVLGWLLAYHTVSFDLHGRYLPHEVITWLINDFTKEFIAERRSDR